MIDDKLLTYLQGFLTPKRVDLFKEVLAQRTRHFTVVAEDVRHLHNTSAVIRSCEAFGIQDVHVIEELKGKRIDKEIAMGAQKWTSIHRHAAVKDAIQSLKAKKYQIVATTPHHKSHTLASFDVTKPAALFFGREAEGLSEYVIDTADSYIYIPTSGFTQSLNISVSAAIIIQSVMQRLKESGISWQLSVDEQKELELLWTKQNLKNIDKIMAKFEQD